MPDKFLRYVILDTESNGKKQMKEEKRSLYASSSLLLGPTVTGCHGLWPHFHCVFPMACHPQQLQLQPQNS